MKDVVYNVMHSVRDHVSYNTGDNVKENVWDYVRGKVYANVNENVCNHVYTDADANVMTNVCDNVKTNVMNTIDDGTFTSGQLESAFSNLKQL